MKKPQLPKYFVLCLFVLLSFTSFSQVPLNNTCAGAFSITPAYTCSGASQLTGQTLLNATTDGLATTCGTANSPDVWYSFVATSTRPTITTSNLGTSWGANMRIQVFSRTGPCAGLAEVRCGSSPLTPTTDLTLGATYYIRILKTTTTAATGANWGFDICVTNAPVNDHCADAITLPVGGSCAPTAGNLYGAVQTNPTGSVCGNRWDVWYKFTLPSNPEATFATIIVSLTSSPSTLTNTNTFIELFNANLCPVANSSVGNCNNISSQRSYMGLTPGATYLFRVNTNTNTNTNPTRWGFNVCVTSFIPFTVGSGRRKEVFQQTVLSPPGVLADPWEITYGPDNKLWITEAKGYKVYRMDPATGVKTTVLDVSQGSTFFSAPADVAFNCQFNNGSGAQGGFAGLALHPNFLDGTASEKNFVYVSYVYDDSSNASYFTNRVVRFTYNAGTNRLESPVSLCDTLPGSNDHNSQRMIIAPVTPGGTKYLFYASGDMGAGQGNNTNVVRPIKSQYPNSYEGKILRFNLETDGESGLDGWIPNDNPYNIPLGVQSAVWTIGIRNNQGFAYDSTLNKLYGSSHGPYSDDEINVLEPFRNYGHPLVIGYVADGNYDGTMTASSPTSLSAGTPYGNATFLGNSSCPPIGSEATRMAEINAAGNGSYKDPLFSAYPGESGVVAGTVAEIWGNTSTPNNGTWPSEGWSGLDLYTKTLVPGWKKSLVAASLKWGRLVRLKLSPTGTATLPNNDIHDTISYFGSQNRFRDLAFGPNGKDIYVIMDRSTTTSGPSSLFPVVPTCQGCVQKYTFLGYADDAGKSSIPPEIDITAGTANTLDTGTTVTIDAANSNYWVPITGPDGNIMAEIFANGQTLGTVLSSFYKNVGPVRAKNSLRYLDRSITINPSIAPTGPVKVRFYISTAEYLALAGAAGSFVDDPSDLKIFKNSDANGTAMTAATTSFMPHSIDLHGTGGYVLQSDTISSFSTFYFAGASSTLPVDLISFTGSLQNNNSVLLKWQTENEVRTAYFSVERSIDGNRFTPIGSVTANGNGTVVFNYSYVDNDAMAQSSPVVYYRLRMVDADGVFTYSNIVTINLPYISGRVAVFPNPFAGELTLSIGAPKDGRVQWSLFDNAGRMVMRNTETVRKGNNNIQISVSKLPAGTYYMSVSGAGIDQQVKLQKL